MPAEIILAIEKVVAAYPNDDVAKALAAVLGEVQVLEARSRDFTDDSISSWSIAMKDNLVMAAGIIARCVNLFTFARKGTEHGEPTRSQIQCVLNGAKIRDFTYPRVWEATERFADDPKPTGRQRRLLKKIPGMFRSL